MIVRLLTFAFLLIVAAPQAFAGTITITPVSPLEAAPSGAVGRGGLAPIPGVDVAPARSGPPPAYAPEYGRRVTKIASAAVPVPAFNRAAVSWCQMNLYP